MPAIHGSNPASFVRTRRPMQLAAPEALDLNPNPKPPAAFTASISP
jgi:hypothetical protein